MLTNASRHHNVEPASTFRVRKRTKYLVRLEEDQRAVGQQSPISH